MDNVLGLKTAGSAVFIGSDLDKYRKLSVQERCDFILQFQEDHDISNFDLVKDKVFL